MSLHRQCDRQLRSGSGVVVEGAAARVTGEVQLQLLATMWKSKLD
jgi:hypothetical protein